MVFLDILHTERRWIRVYSQTGGSSVHQVVCSQIPLSWSHLTLPPTSFWITPHRSIETIETDRPRNGTTPERNDPEIIKINSQSLEDATTFHQKSGYHSGLFLVCYKTSNGLLKMSNNKMLNVCITIKYGLQILKCWNVFDIIFSLCYY